MIVYRAARVEDAEALAAFAARSFCETFAHLYPPADLAAYLAKSYSVEIIRDELADPDVRYALALKDGAIVGYSMWGPVDLKAQTSDNAFELYRLYVDGSVKGAGVAHRLMNDVVEQARAAGGNEIWLSVWENNERAQRFYRAYGFEHRGEHKFMVGSVADRDLIWRAELH